MTVVGTRPEIIRLSRLIPKFDEEFNHVLIHTGQNYDPMLSDVFFEELRLRQPDEYLNIDHSSLGKTIGDLFVKFEEALDKYKPDGVFILGDTNSALVAILAKRMQIPVYHWEAGNRSFDENVPEETNRRIVDHTAHFNIAYSYPAEANLVAEGLAPGRILLSGSPMGEVLDFYEGDIEKSQILKKEGLSPRGYFLASIHRQENVDAPQRLVQILEGFEQVSKIWNIPTIISTHPRTRERIKSVPDLRRFSSLNFHEPLGFFDFIKLQKESFCVLSDSGSISEESAILNFPAVTIRDSMERPEALTSGSIIMTGLETDSLIEGIRSITSTRGPAPAEYLLANPSERVLKLIKDTIGSFEEWSGVRGLQGFSS